MAISSSNLADLLGLRRTELTTAWTEIFGSEAPFRPNPELYRNGIAWTLQERKDPMSSALRKRLNQLANSVERKQGRQTARISKGSRLRAGTTIVKEWRDNSHVVMVAEKGFVYDGKKYRSLSEIAREITGTRWNGPAFFGLRTSTDRVTEVAHG